MVSGWLADFLRTLLPVFLRTLGMLILVPIEFGLSGAIFKISLSLLLAVLFSYGMSPPIALSLPLLAFEIVLGLVLSLPFALVVAFAKMIGELFDTVRGQSIADMLDPLHGQGSSYTGMLLQYWSFSTLLSMGALESLTVSLYHSLQRFPLGQLELSSVSAHSLSLIHFMALSLNGAFAAFLPFALVFFAIEFVFAYLSRMLPQVSLQAESFLVKSIAGMMCLVALSRFDIMQSMRLLAAPFEQLLSQGG